MEVTGLSSVDKVHLTEKVTPEQRLEAGEGRSHVGVWGRAF